MKDAEPTISDNAERCDFIREVNIPFLTETFATAYKGSIASLIIQNLSISKLLTGRERI
jgi:hypothetical protein